MPLKDHRGRPLLILVVALAMAVAPGAASAQVVPSLVPARSSPNDDIVRLLEAGVGEPIILDIIAGTPGTFDTSVSAMIRLKAAGASDQLLAAVRDVDAARPPASLGARHAEAPRAGEIIIPDGTEVRLRLIERLSSATARVGDKVRFEVVEDVRVDNRIAIPAGAPAAGTITVAESKKSFGRRGRLDFTIDSVKAPGDQTIPVRVTKRAQGDERYLTAGVITYFTIVGGLFVRGKDVEVDLGTQYPIYIDGERRLTALPAHSAY